MNTTTTQDTKTQTDREIEQIEWKKIDITVVRKLTCPKCGENGRMNKSGLIWSGTHQRQQFLCRACGHRSTEMQLNLEGIATEPVKKFDISEHSPSRQSKFNWLIAFAKEHPKFGAIRLGKALRQEFNSGFSKTEVVKIKNLVKEGYFDV